MAFFDGAATVTAGVASGGAGAVLFSASGRAVGWAWERLASPATNNQAEYAAAQLALGLGRGLDVQRLLVVGDSRLVVCQLRREWAVRHPDLRRRWSAAVEAASHIPLVEFCWVPRGSNLLADALSRHGLSQCAPGTWTSPTPPAGLLSADGGVMALAAQDMVTGGPSSLREAEARFQQARYGREVP